MNFIALAFALTVGACPRFVEILPDPSDVEDSRGEFVEIRLPHTPLQSPLSVFFERKKVWEGEVPDSADRILLIRDTSLCPRLPNLLCERLSGTALPNSRKSRWELESGTCGDAAELPVPKSGFSFSRSDSAFDAWSFSPPSPGYPDGNFESDVNDCRLRIDTLVYAPSGWRGEWTLSGCDSATVRATFRSQNSLSETELSDVLARDVRTRFDTRLGAKAIEIRASWPPDDVPGNDFLDTLVALPGNFPVRISEVHPCPEEGIPEWFEIYNGGSRAIPLGKMNLCGNRDTKFPDAEIGSRESVVLTRDSGSMRSFVGNADVAILSVPFHYLKNASDSLYLCYGAQRVDSVFWGKSGRIRPHCPEGFSTATGRSENSPGFQTPGSIARDASADVPFRVEWNARVFSRGNGENPLMIRVRSDGEFLVELISGKGDLLWKGKFPADAGGNRWVKVPLLEKGFPGPNFLRVSLKNFEKRIGVILRP